MTTYMKTKLRHVRELEWIKRLQTPFPSDLTIISSNKEIFPEIPNLIFLDCLKLTKGILDHMAYVKMVTLNENLNNVLLFKI